MGGDLGAAPAGKSPTWLVMAPKGPIGRNLDCIQIVKGWFDERGGLHEQLFDVVWSDADRCKPAADGKPPSVGSTVEVGNVTRNNTIGDPEMIASGRIRTSTPSCWPYAMRG